jgi:hypothetical protein
MPRLIVIITAVIWLLLLLGGPLYAVLPLYGFYPAALESGQPTYNLAAIKAWGITMGAALAALALIALVRNHRPLAILFMALFLLSTLISLARLSTE